MANAEQSGHLAIIGVQQTAEPFTAEDRAFCRTRRVRLDDAMTEHPMWPLGEIMSDVLVYNISHVLLADQDHLVQTLSFYGPHERLGKRIYLRRRLHPVRTMRWERFALPIHSILAAANSSSW